MPKLPVARVLWKPRPDLATAAECWIIAGGAHHTGYSRVVKAEWLRDWAEMARETVTWGRRLQDDQRPVPGGPVHDALAAVDLGAGRARHAGEHLVVHVRHAPRLLHQYPVVAVADGHEPDALVPRVD